MTDDLSGIKLRIPGTELSSPLLDDSAAMSGQITFEEVRSFQIDATRAGMSEAPIIESFADDIVEVELEDGTRFWTTQEQLRTSILSKATTRSQDGIIELPATLSRSSASRGMFGTVVIKTLKFFKIDVAEKAAQHIAEKMELHALGKTEDGLGPGLFRIARGDALNLKRVEEAVLALPEDKPSLVFLHGTMSSTAGSFGKLWSEQRRQQRDQLLAPYEGRLFALEHATLTKNPIDNAIALAERLPPLARLHLVSHSRGGMVGELLCRAGVGPGHDPFDAAECALFNKSDPDGLRGDLERLNTLLAEKRFRIERFVRVACPTRGTTLASGRLDLYLSVLFNLLEKIAGPANLPLRLLTSLMSELIMAVAKKRSDPSVLPGIEAMMPTSPLVALLNRCPPPVAGTLRVIAGDIEGETPLSVVSTLLTNPLYLADHDMVVNTDSMFGGAEREGGASFLFQRGPQVNHFNYFFNPDSAQGLTRALTGDLPETEGFTPFSVQEGETGIVPYEKRDLAQPMPRVFLLPGIMGSHLAINDNRIWLDLLDITVGKFDLLRPTTPNLVVAEALLAHYYGDLVKHLSTSHHVIPFPFDWRLPLFEEGERLAEAVAQSLDECERDKQPLHLVAHSMGGLVVRAMIAAHPELWERIKGHPRSRFIMLGTPNNGSHVIPQVLTGRDGLVRRLALLDTRHNLAEFITIVGQFPGLLEMMPTHGSLDLFAPEQWKELADIDAQHNETWQPPSPAMLQAAKATRQRLAQAPMDPERMLYIAGCAPATPCDLRIDATEAQPRLAFRATPCGDGRVPWKSGIPSGITAWYLDAAHGDLPREEKGFAAIADLLQYGTTEQLPVIPPMNREMAVEEDTEMPLEHISLYPNYSDLAQAAFGAGQRKRKRSTTRKIEVAVHHGNLAFAHHPVLVGHYKGDGIISAEAYLDRTLGHRLSARHQIGLYPGNDGTAEAFLNHAWEQSRRSDGMPPGAIVIGLGEIGQLTPGRLMRAVSRGVRTYILARAECADRDHLHPESIGISALLVGTGAGGVSVQDAVNAILRGIIDANRTIRDAGNARCIPLQSVDFVELYEDRAIQTVRILARLRNDPEIASHYTIAPDPLVIPMEGGQRRASFFEDDPWWQRLQIVEDNTGQLSFNLLTDRARTEVYLQHSQRSLADQFIAETSATVASNAGVATTLFEMLIPNELKDYAPERKDLVLVLNERAARYPWEMMQERSRGHDLAQSVKPLAVQAGMIRQLQVERFRDRVLMARGKTALIIANPLTPFADLPAAQEEAQGVVTTLQRQGYSTTALIGQEAKGTAILRELFARDYAIVHLAGHGVYQYRPPTPKTAGTAENEAAPMTGMVIGDNQFLTAAQIHQMRTVPQLVFINCCHLGKTEENQPSPNLPPHMASNLATELIRMGVRGVVAAGWAVQDKAAARFAATFYQELLSGATFGQAVLAARTDTYAAFPEVNTWGAYQCYGDPDFVLGKGEQLQRANGRHRTYSALSEAIIDLEGITAAAGISGGHPLEEQLRTIKDIEKSVPPAWLDTGSLQAALGRAYGELNLFAEAVEHCRRALADNRALVPIKVAEQRWHLQSLWALELAESDRDKALSLIDEAEAHLTGLTEVLGPSEERLSLLGGIAKRRVMIAKQAEQKHDGLNAMAEHFRQAYAWSAEQGKPDYYPLLNYLTAKTLAALLEETAPIPADFKTSLRTATELAAHQHALQPNFWSTVTPIDCRLLSLLATNQLPEHSAEIIIGYHNAHNVASPKEYNDVVRHLDFLINVLDSAPRSEKRGNLVPALLHIRQAVVSGEPPSVLSGFKEVEVEQAEWVGPEGLPPAPERVFLVDSADYPEKMLPPLQGIRGPRLSGEFQGPPQESRPKMSATYDEAAPELEPVQLGASAPKQVKPGDEFTARFVAYAKELEAATLALLKKLAPEEEPVLGIQECRWKRGTSVTVRLSARGLMVDPEEQTFTWEGGRSMLPFDLTVPADAAETKVKLKFDVAIQGIIVARLRLEVDIVAKPRKKGTITATGEPATTAFASYSSKDRMRVLDRVDAIQIAAGLDIFQDCLDLHPGEEFKPRLDHEIRERDLFLLFWSHNSSQSQWVQWELTTALAEKGEEALQIHPLDPGIQPPPGLEQYNIGSVVMWVRKGYEAVQREQGRLP